MAKSAPVPAEAVSTAEEETKTEERESEPETALPTETEDPGAAQAADEPEAREKRKKKVGKDALCDFIDILLSLLRDALLLQLGAGEGRNTDAQSLQKAVAEHFTTAEIQCMIAETLEKRRVLTELNGSTGAVLDGLLVSLRKREKKEDNGKGNRS